MFYEFIYKNKYKRFSDVFNEKLVLKTDTYAVAGLIRDFIPKMKHLNEEDELFVEYLVSKGRNKNPDKRITMIQLYYALVSKMKKMK